MPESFTEVRAAFESGNADGDPELGRFIHVYKTIVESEIALEAAMRLGWRDYTQLVALDLLKEIGRDALRELLISLYIGSQTSTRDHALRHAGRVVVAAIKNTDE